MINPILVILFQIPNHPGLTGNVDPTKIDEIRRTVYVGNLTSSVCQISCLSFNFFVYVNSSVARYHQNR